MLTDLEILQLRTPYDQIDDELYCGKYIVY